MHYVTYLDEFGHIGPYVSKDHPQYNDSPVFGFAGFVLPVEQVREFAIFFYKLKCNLLRWELVNDNLGNRPPYRWEKKGSALYTVININKYRELRQATFRLINQIKKVGGHVFYTGEHKAAEPRTHSSADTFKRQLVQAIRKIDRFCAEKNHTFMLLIDEQNAGDRWRERNVEACTLAMFEDPAEKCRTLIEPPIQGESHLFQTLQCADWICGLVGRLAAFSVAPDEYADWGDFEKYFGHRIKDAALTCSGLEHRTNLTSEPHATAELLANAPSVLVDQL
ncbi:MAG: DUF3800 domain-containing protein [Trinickia sp.]|uniref:DUF3800 domain-containing protein n=1 Tax=Trinickia sp. TaxID=2571163 RepID=UPI003F80485B